MLVDFHMHSVYSDGIKAPKELLRHAIRLQSIYDGFELIMMKLMELKHCVPHRTELDPTEND